MSDSEESGPGGGVPDWAAALLLSEAAALLIALATALVPGRSGSTWSPADVLYENPSLLQRVVASFVLLNVVLGVLGTGAWFLVRRTRSP